MKIPKSINPCPIAEAVLEIRFKPSVHPNAVFGLTYDKFKVEFENLEKLPILQIPESILSIDPNLRHKPHYKSEKDNIIYQIGPDVLSISNIKKYEGWENFSIRIKNMLEKIHNANVIGEITRIGIRYINFFGDMDIFNNIRLKLFIDDESFSSEQLIINSTLKTGSFYTTLKIVNNADLKSKDFNNKGSAIDIDTFITNDKKSLNDNVYTTIDEAHIQEKKLFFTLLNEAFLNSLNPKY